MGPLFRFRCAHRATLARQLAAERRVLLEGTQARLRAQLGVSDTEMHSLLRLVRSGLHLSLERALG